jgi:hypothetical protein
LEQFFGMQKQIVSPTDFARTRNILPATAFHTPETTMMQETHEPPGGSTLDPSAASAGGSETAREPVNYQKGTGRKS